MFFILFNESLLVVIYVGEGSNFVENLDDIFFINFEYYIDLIVLGIIVDVDKENLEKVVVEYY